MTVNTLEHRTSKIIGFKAFFERDDDILDWWENIPSGERSHVLRSLIRAYLTGEVVITPYGEEAVAFSSSVQLARVQSDTTQIRDAIREIPTYIEQIISKKMRTVQVASTTSDAMPSANATEKDAEMRAQSLQKKSW
jgi:hypothetical protein